MNPLPESNMELNHRFNGNAGHNPKTEKDGTDQREREVRPTQGLEVRCTRSLQALQFPPG
jgi:hypothetical protein